MNRRILIGYDGSPDADAALAWALDEATRIGAPAELLYGEEWPLWVPGANMVPLQSTRSESYAEQATRRMLDSAVAWARQTHPLVRVTATTARVHASVALIERSRQARLIVIGSRGHSVVANLFGSVSSAVCAHARCSVAVVRGDARTTAPVVAGVDGSALASPVLIFAAQQAAERKAPLRVIRTWPPVTGLWESSSLITRIVTEHEREPFDTLVAAVRDTYPDLDIAGEATVAHPATALTRAGATAQLLVVGSRGRGAIRGMFLGSVSQHLLRHAACTVAVVHI
ncbi:universal stress protein [Actinoplanes sp. NPDC024001]|uniref:universal stress protein n=1 Tax=Actinoplanes sp. NPDC024001 TaxID=3154598 RepID=UPI0033DE6130